MQKKDKGDAPMKTDEPMEKWEKEFEERFASSAKPFLIEDTTVDDVLTFFRPLIPVWKDAVKEPPEQGGFYITDNGYHEFRDGRWILLYTHPKYWLSVPIPPLPKEEDAKKD